VTLRDALLDSRQRWRALVTMAADFAFETDVWGRLVFVFPDQPLGWPEGMLVGQSADLLLADAPGFNPFRLTVPVRRRRVWLRRPDGSAVCLMFAAAPIQDDQGRVIGARGVGQDVTEQDGYDAALAASLRRSELLDHILWRMRKEVLAPRMMQAALEAMVAALGAEGCAVVDTLDAIRPGSGAEPYAAAAPVVLHSIGMHLPIGEDAGSMASEPPGPVLAAAVEALTAEGRDPVQTTASDGRRLLVCPGQTRYGEQAGFVLWRGLNGRHWDAEDLVLANSATGIIRIILEHEAIQREMARQARTDPLTGLLNRRAFLDDMARRIDRLEREALPGTLMFIDLDHFKALNDSRGHDIGDEALCITAALLRSIVRPSDLVARLGGDEFAVWLDGADGFTAAERAEYLRVAGPEALAHLGPEPGLAHTRPSHAGVPPLTMSIGIATRWPGRGADPGLSDDIEMLIHRADQAMYDVKRGGRGHWRAATAEAL
jgi:diguanylate cyclase (GGDEF)-like protein